MDVIWSEGAVYIIGLERGLREWRRLLKPEGYIVVSELTWLADSPPEECKDFWADSYPSMKKVHECKQIIEEAGYSLIESFTLPEAGWWDDYYTPLERRVALLRDQYFGNEDMQRQLDLSQQEIDMYRRYAAFYGYTFFIMQVKQE